MLRGKAWTQKNGQMHRPLFWKRPAGASQCPGGGPGTRLKQSRCSSCTATSCATDKIQSAILHTLAAVRASVFMSLPSQRTSQLTSTSREPSPCFAATSLTRNFSCKSLRQKFRQPPVGPPTAHKSHRLLLGLSALWCGSENPLCAEWLIAPSSPDDSTRNAKQDAGTVTPLQDLP